MLSRLFALPCYCLIALLTLLPLTPAQAVGLPGLLGNNSKTQPQADVPLGQSLDEVIKTLENDQQRTQLLSDLKKLRAAAQKPSPPPSKAYWGSSAVRCRALSSSSPAKTARWGVGPTKSTWPRKNSVR